MPHEIQNSWRPCAQDKAPIVRGIRYVINGMNDIHKGGLTVNYYVDYTYDLSPNCSFPSPSRNTKCIEASSKLEAVDILREKFKDWHRKGAELTEVNYVLTEEEKKKKYVPISPHLAQLLNISTREHIKGLMDTMNLSGFKTFNTEETINALQNDYAELNGFRRDIGLDMI